MSVEGVAPSPSLLSWDSLKIESLYLDGVVEAHKCLLQHLYVLEKSKTCEPISDLATETALYVQEDGKSPATVVWEIKSERGWIRREVWARIFLPLQITCILVNKTVLQTLRGIRNIASGMLEVEFSKIKEGCRDLLSVVVQCFALTFFALGVIFLSPTHAALRSNSLNFCKKYHKVSSFDFRDKNERCRHTIVKVIDVVFGSIISTIDRANRAFNAMANLSFRKTFVNLLSVPFVPLVILISPIFTKIDLTTVFTIKKIRIKESDSSEIAAIGQIKDIGSSQIEAFDQTKSQTTASQSKKPKKNK